MPLVIPTGFSQVTIDHSIPSPGGSKVASTTFGVASEPSALQVTNIFNNYFISVFEPLGSSGVTILGASMRDELFTYEYEDPTAGTNTLALAPPNVTLLVKKSTNGAGRKNRGRMYPPGLCYETTYDETGTMTIGSLNDYQDAFDAFLEGLSLSAAEMVVLHNDETAPTVVQNLVVDPVAATQRRRLR